jgi:predicted PurR-regulated permease PerM
MKEIFFRANQYLLFIVLLIVVMHFGAPFVIPLVFAALLSMLMAPVCRKLEAWGFNRALASLTCIIILLLVFGLIAFIISRQLATFLDNLSEIRSKATELLDRVQAFIQDHIGITPEKQEAMVKEQSEKTSQASGSIVAKILGGLTSTISGMILSIVITFLMIFNKEQFENFFLQLFVRKDTSRVKVIIDEITQVSQAYLTGRAKSVLIDASLYSIGLLIVGVKNAVLWGCIAATLTVIPYVGTILGGLMPVMMALLTQDVRTALFAGAVLLVIQTIDNYFIEPNVVGGQVNLSALTSILGILLGGLIWGVAGMILFLPILGIVKIVCDHVDELKPIGYLLGEPGGHKPSKIAEWIKVKFNRAKRKGK